MFSFTINPSSPSELAEYIAVIQASGIQSPSIAITGKPAASDLAERYRAATGKSKAHIPRAELIAAGWDGQGDPTQEDKDKAMRLVIGATETAAPEQGATYEPEGEIPQPGDDVDGY